MIPASDGTFFDELWFKIKLIFLKGLGLLSSRKFWAAVAATILVMQQNGANLEAVLNQITAVWIAFILGTALEDGLSRR